MKSFLLILLFAMACVYLLPTGLATSTQQYNKIFLSPFYVQSFSAGNPVYFGLNVSARDNIGSVVAAIINFNAQINGQSQNFTLSVNGTYCVPSSYYIATAFSTTGNVQFYFDCTKAITKAGFYNISLISAVNTGAISGWLDLTYMNNPPSLQTGGTEYSPNENGTVFVQLLNGNENPINLGNCNTTIYYPNKTVWLNDQVMTLLDAKGVYYYDLTTPNITGNYISIFNCMFPANIFTQNKSYLETFTSGSYPDSFFFDDTDNVTINLAYVEMNTKGSASSTVAGLYFNGHYIGNNSGSSQQTGNWTLPASYFVLGESQDVSIVQLGSGTITLYWLHLYINYTWNNPFQVIRGQTELHVGLAGQTIGQINSTINIPNPNISAILNNTQAILTNTSNIYSNQQLILGNQSIIQSNQASLNSTILATNSSLSSQISSLLASITSFYNNLVSLINSNFLATNNTLININSTLPFDIWFFGNRSANATNIINITNVTSVFNITNQTVEVLNQTLNVTVINQTVNVTSETVTVAPQYVNVTNVTLNVTTVTVQNVTLNVTNQTVGNVTVTAISEDALRSIAREIIEYLYALRCDLWGYAC
jgi:hypothetical protein